MRSAVFLLCWISVLRGEISINPEKCERDVENCENFSFRRTSQHLNNSKVNNSIESKHVKSEVLTDLGTIENQLVFEQSHVQENGNSVAWIKCSTLFTLSIEKIAMINFEAIRIS